MKLAIFTNWFAPLLVLWVINGPVPRWFQLIQTTITGTRCPSNSNHVERKVRVKAVVVIGKQAIVFTSSKAFQAHFVLLQLAFLPMNMTTSFSCFSSFLPFPVLPVTCHTTCPLRLGKDVPENMSQTVPPHVGIDRGCRVSGSGLECGSRL